MLQLYHSHESLYCIRTVNLLSLNIWIIAHRSSNSFKFHCKWHSFWTNCFIYNISVRSLENFVNFKQNLCINLWHLWQKTLPKKYTTIKFYSVAFLPQFKIAQYWKTLSFKVGHYAIKVCFIYLTYDLEGPTWPLI